MNKPVKNQTTPEEILKNIDGIKDVNNREELTKGMKALLDAMDLFLPRILLIPAHEVKTVIMSFDEVRLGMVEYENDSGFTVGEAKQLCIEMVREYSKRREEDSPTRSIEQAILNILLCAIDKNEKPFEDHRVEDYRILRNFLPMRTRRHYWAL